MVVFHQDSFLSGWSYEGGLVRVVLPGWCHIMAVSNQGFLWDLHTVMDACEVLNLILKIFFSILSKLTRGDVLVLLFTLEWDAWEFYPLDFAVRNVTMQFFQKSRFWPSICTMYCCSSNNILCARFMVRFTAASTERWHWDYPQKQITNPHNWGILPVTGFLLTYISRLKMQVSPYGSAVWGPQNTHIYQIITRLWRTHANLCCYCVVQSLHFNMHQNWEREKKVYMLSCHVWNPCC